MVPHKCHPPKRDCSRAMVKNCAQREKSEEFVWDEIWVGSDSITGD